MFKSVYVEEDSTSTYIPDFEIAQSHVLYKTKFFLKYNARRNILVQ